VAELALDHVQRHSLASHLDRARSTVRAISLRCGTGRIGRPRNSRRWHSCHRRCHARTEARNSWAKPQETSGATSWTEGSSPMAGVLLQSAALRKKPLLVEGFSVKRPTAYTGLQ
jgi:hypothetical protein